MREFKIVKEDCRKHKHVNIVLPERSTSGSAGYDFVTPIDIRIGAHCTSDLIFTDIKAIMNPDEFMQLHIRSSLGVKKGLMLANTVGIIDSDYANNPDNDGNIGFKLANYSNDQIFIKAGEKVVQGIFMKYLTVDEDKVNISRDGGFGSTGK